MKRREFISRMALAAAGATVVPGCETDDGGSGSGGADAGGADAGGADRSADGSAAPLPTYEYTGEPGPKSLFTHGVASGDPLADAVILWTRVTLDALADKAPASVEVFWEIATDDAFTDRVGAGTVTTDAGRDFTVKIDATGLSPATRYHYRFYCMGRASVIGRTLTAPAGETAHVRFGVCSCAKYTGGYYMGYRLMAEREDLAAVLHLGDYIYESDTSKGVRPNDPPHRCVKLPHYRRRYAQQRTDADLQLLHQRHPMIAVWDDHETANNSYRDGAQGHGKADGDWAKRKAAGMQAWREWLPVREADDPTRIWRHFGYGDLLDLIMLDTRLWGRPKQINFGKSNADKINAESRSMLGADQEAWLADRVSGSKARWVVIGQQVMMAPLTFNGINLNNDQWDNYPATRKRLAEAAGKRAARDLVVLTGDIHSSWANELVLDPDGYKAGGGDAWGVEFICPGITSSGLPPGADKLFLQARSYNPQVRWVDLIHRGLILLDVTADKVQADWYHLGAVNKPYIKAKFATGWSVAHGKTALQQKDKPAA